MSFLTDFRTGGAAPAPAPPPARPVPVQDPGAFAPDPYLRGEALDPVPPPTGSYPPHPLSPATEVVSTWPPAPPAPPVYPPGVGYPGTPGYAVAPYPPHAGYGGPTSWAPAPMTGSGYTKTVRGMRDIRRTCILIAAAVALIGGVVTKGRAYVFPSGHSFVSQSGAVILQKSLAAARQTGTTHLVASQTLDGQVTTMTFDMTPQGSTGQLVLGTETVGLVTVDGTVYINGDAAYLSRDMGLPTPTAEKYGNQWLSVPASDDADLSQVAEFTQTTILIDEVLSLTGTIQKIPPTQVATVAMTGKLADNALNQGSVGDTATIDISTTAPHYPVSLSSSDPQNGAQTLTFSNWGEHVTVTPPTQSVPLASIVGRGDSTSS